MPAAGRPTDYKPNYHPEQVRKLSLLGFSNLEIAKAFGIGTRTFYDWRKNNPEFSEACKIDKATDDAKVALSFFKRATGYTYESEQIVVLSDGNGNSHVERVPILKHVPPDVGAALNWLKNRQPHKWRNKQQPSLPPEFILEMNLDGESTKPVED